MTSTILEAVQTLTNWVELSILAKATVILVMGLSSVRLAGRARASLRHLLLVATFAALLALPLIAIVAPGLTFEIPSPQESNIVAPLNAAPTPNTVRPNTNSSPIHPTIEREQWSMPSLTTIARSIGIVGAMILLVSLGFDLRRLRRIRKNSLPSLKLRETTRLLATESGVSRNIEVLLHEEITSPLTCGTWHPTIVLPADALNWSEADLRRALVHELEHVRRADWIVQLIVRTTCACYWFHPLAWIALRRLCLEAERACDDAVVRDAGHIEYAEQLVSLARRMSKTHSHLALGMANRSELSTRVSALLDASQRRGRAGLLAAAVVMCVASFLVIAIAPLRAVAQSKNLTRGAAIEFKAGIEPVESRGATGASAKVVAQPNDPRHVNPINPSPSSPTVTQEPNSDTRNTRQHRSTLLDQDLFEAAESGDTSDINRLLDAGANVNCAMEGDGSPLIAAARAGHLAAVRLLLDRGADPNLAVSGDGTPLIMAAREGYADIVALLLDRGASIDKIVPDDENALIQASGEGHIQVVKLLVSRGADVNARAWVDWAVGQPKGEWRTPLSMARKGKHTAVVTFLLSAGARD
jgi:beta-lactamase regulating signal transducer with metallopeptidase domain